MLDFRVPFHHPGHAVPEQQFAFIGNDGDVEVCPYRAENAAKARDGILPEKVRPAFQQGVDDVEKKPQWRHVVLQRMGGCLEHHAERFAVRQRQQRGVVFYKRMDAEYENVEGVDACVRERDSEADKHCAVRLERFNVFDIREARVHLYKRMYNPLEGIADTEAVVNGIRGEAEHKVAVALQVVGPVGTQQFRIGGAEDGEAVAGKIPGINAASRGADGGREDIVDAFSIIDVEQ